MTIENIKQTELTASERAVLDEDRKRWKRVGDGAHLDEWLAFAPGVGIRRRLAMRLAYTNEPKGKGYIKHYNELLRDDGFDTADRKLMSNLTAVQWLYDEAERQTILRDIRETMSPGERSRLNSPISAKQRVLAVLKARDGGAEAEAALQTSPVARLKRQLTEAQHANADLQERLAAADAGSLFDLKKDGAEAIGRIIVDVASENKARHIAIAIKNILADKKKRQQTPAG